MIGLSLGLRNSLKMTRMMIQIAVKRTAHRLVSVIALKISMYVWNNKIKQINLTLVVCNYPESGVLESSAKPSMCCRTGRDSRTMNFQLALFVVVGFRMTSSGQLSLSRTLACITLKNNGIQTMAYGHPYAVVAKYGHPQPIVTGTTFF